MDTGVGVQRASPSQKTNALMEARFVKERRRSDSSTGSARTFVHDVEAAADRVAAKLGPNWENIAMSLATSATRVLGEAGEDQALSLLHAKGYSTAQKLRVNSPVVDIEVPGPRPFRVSVKAARDRQHVRLGSYRSVRQLGPADFLFAFLPVGKQPISFEPGGYRLLILPGEMVREDAFAVTDSYHAERGRPDWQDSYNFSMFVKGYSRRPIQAETWARWLAHHDRWDILSSRNS